MKLASSKLAKRWGLPRPIIKSHAEKGGRDNGLGELPKFLEFPFNISATTEDSNFKISRLVGLAKAHHEIPPRRKKESVAL